MANADSKDFFEEFNAIEWKTYDTFSALAAFATFWKETERLVSEAADVSEKNPTWSPETGDPATDFFESRRFARHLHDEVVFIEASLAAAQSLFSDLFAKIGWRVNDQWLPKPTPSQR